MDDGTAIEGPDKELDDEAIYRALKAGLLGSGKSAGLYDTLIAGERAWVTLSNEMATAATEEEPESGKLEYSSIFSYPVLKSDAIPPDEVIVVKRRRELAVDLRIDTSRFQTAMDDLARRFATMGDAFVRSSYHMTPAQAARDYFTSRKAYEWFRWLDSEPAGPAWKAYLIITIILITIILIVGV